MISFINKLCVFALFVIIKNSCFSQINTFSATPQSATNCSSCTGDTWTVTPYCYIIYSNATGFSKDLNLTNLGFNIPANAIIKGISLAISSFSCMPEEYYDSDVKLLVNNIPTGSNKATSNNFLPYPSYNNIMYGDTNDSWGNALTPLIINDVNFGVTLKFMHSVSTSFSCFQLNGPFPSMGPFSFPAIKVYYVPATSNTNTPTASIIESQTSNPATLNAFSFEGKMYVNNTSSEIIENAKMRIYNSLGEIIFSEQKTIAPKEIESFSVNSSITGFYFFTLTSSKNELIYSKKIFINPE